jgi:hypothetical protein
MAQGLVGAQDGLTGTTGVEDDGFYVRAVVGTKHYSNYLAQWYRQTASNSVTARGLYEYQTRSAIKGLASGAVSGVMTSFGRTNGIPNIIMPTMHYANGMPNMASIHHLTSMVRIISIRVLAMVMIPSMFQ